MRREVELEAMRRLARMIDDPSLAPAPRTTRLDVARYLDESQFHTERAALFGRHPIAVVHTSELPQEGSFVTAELAGTPLLVVRTERGVAVHVNACRHRGARLQCEAKGRAKAFTCPYHAWSYRLDGELFHVPGRESFADLDLTQHGLHRVPHEVRHGFVWVGLGGSFDLPAYLDGLDDDFSGFALDRHHMARSTERTIPANWKLVMDAFAEGYHVKSLHRETLARFFHGAALVDHFSPHVRQIGARKSFAEAAQGPESAWSLRRHATAFYNVFPCSVAVFHPGWVSWLTLHPVAVDRMRFVHRALVPPDMSEQDRARFEKSFAHIDDGVFEREDLAIAQSIQSTLGSGANRFVTLGASEEGMRLFHTARDAALASGDEPG